jgi:hypothetical protein
VTREERRNLSASFRALSFSSGATESSRSMIATSAPAAIAFGNRSGRVAGVNNQLRLAALEGLVIGDLLSNREVDAAAPLIQYPLIASVICLENDGGTSTHSDFFQSRMSAASREQRQSGLPSSSA